MQPQKKGRKREHLHARKRVKIRKVKHGNATFSKRHSGGKNIYIHKTLYIIWMHYLLTVAKSFWVRPLSCLPCWMTLPTSSVTLSWCSSSVSRSSLAVFFVTRCCLFCPADPERQAAVNLTAVEVYLKNKGKEKQVVSYHLTLVHSIWICLHIHFLVVSTSSPRLWALAMA